MVRVVVIGAGHAGVELANALRHSGFAGAIVLVNDEADLPYQKPPLSKDFLKSDGRNPLMLKAEVFYTQNSITLLRGRRAVAIDRAAKLVRLDEEFAPGRVGFGRGLVHCEKTLHLAGFRHTVIVERGADLSHLRSGDLPRSENLGEYIARHGSPLEKRGGRCPRIAKGALTGKRLD